MKNNNINHLSYFRRIALKRINKKDEPLRVYPINHNDLIKFHRCPLCNSSHLEIISEVYLNNKLNFFTTAVCKDCIFTFRSISPNFSWFKKCWAMISSDNIEVFNPVAEKFKLRRYKIYKKLILPYYSRGKLLDIGGSYGTGSNFFKKHGFDVEVIEAEENKIKYLKKSLGIKVVAKSIEEFLNNPAKKYDVVIFSNCLEHLDNPLPIMERLGNIIKPDGIILISLPSFWGNITWSDALYLTHKSNFTSENVSEFLAKNNLESVEKIYVPYGHNEFVWIIKKMPRRINISFDYSDSAGLIKEIKQLYRKDMPIKNIPPISKIIRYNVPHINQFFQTVNLMKMKVREPDPDGTITFTYDNN